MARGRKPANPDQPKTQQTSIRFSAALLDRLQDAAKADGRTVTEEITRRLEGSFIGKEADFINTLGGHQTYALVLLIAQALRELRDDTGQRWHADRFTFDHAVVAINEILTYFRPSGRRTVPADMPMAEAMRAQQLKTGEVRSQARTFPFGKLAGRMAVFRVEFPPPEGQELKPHHQIFRRIALELRKHLAHSPQADLLKWSKK